MTTSWFLSRITSHAADGVPNIDITLSQRACRHLVLTGRAGSGKTVVLQAIYKALRRPAAPASTSPVEVTFAHRAQWEAARRENAAILAYYPSDVRLAMRMPDGRQPLPEARGMGEHPGEWFVPYLITASHHSPSFESWLARLDSAFQQLFQDSSLALELHHHESPLRLISHHYASIDFARLSEGQHLLLSIFCDLVMRMELRKPADYDMPGIVVLDDLGAHLHIDIQCHLLPFLTTFFPNLQFLVSTHSPSIVNSVESAVVVDLDHHAGARQSAGIPYDLRLERHELRQYSDQIKQLLGEYEALLNKKLKNEREDFRLLELGNYLAWLLTKFREERRKAQ